MLCHRYYNKYLIPVFNLADGDLFSLKNVFYDFYQREGPIHKSLSLDLENKKKAGWA